MKIQYGKVLIVGANGMLGTTLQNIADTSNCLLLDKESDTSNIKYCDIRDMQLTSQIVNAYAPDIIINLAALVDLEYCETNKDDCYITNTIGAVHLFNLAKERDIPYVFISTAGIFGNKDAVYTELDTPDPLSSYGKSKYYVEQLLLRQQYEKYWIFRAGWMMGGGPMKDKKFVKKFISLAKQHNKLPVVDDKVGVPTYTKDFAASLIKHINEGLPYGLYNMVCQGDASRYDVAVEICRYLGLNVEVTRVSSNFFNNEYFAPRPFSEKLVNYKLNLLGKNYMRDWKVCLHEYLDEYLDEYFG